MLVVISNNNNLKIFFFGCLWRVIKKKSFLTQLVVSIFLKY